MIQKKVFEKAVMNERYRELKKVVKDLESGADVFISGTGDDYKTDETTKLLILQLLTDFMKEGEDLSTK